MKKLVVLLLVAFVTALTPAVAQAQDLDSGETHSGCQDQICDYDYAWHCDDQVGWQCSVAIGGGSCTDAECDEGGDGGDTGAVDIWDLCWVLWPYLPCGDDQFGFDPDGTDEGVGPGTGGRI
jgi:hypothetical protein